MLIYLVLILVVLVALAFYRVKRQEQEVAFGLKFNKIPFRNRRVAIVVAPILTLSIIILIAGFREGIGTDFYSYKEIFQDFVDNGLNLRLELGFSVISYLIAVTTKSSVLFFLVMAALVYIPIFFAFDRHSHYIELTLVLFIVFGFYTNSFNIMRQWIAVAIGLIGMRYVIDKKLIKFTLVVLIALSFHKTAIILFPFYFILRMKGRDTVRIVIILSTVLCAIFFVPIATFLSKIAIDIFGENKYTKYLNPSTLIDESGSWLSFPLICLGVYAVYLYQKRKGIVFSRSMEVIINYIIIGFFFIGLGQLNSLAGRLSSYFVPVICIAIPNLVFNMKYKKYICVIMVAIGIVFFIFTLPVAYRPYVSIFGG